MLWLAMAITLAITAKKLNIPPSARVWPEAKEVAARPSAASWAILFPVMLIVGLRMGVFTPSEVGAFAVVYAVLVGIVAHRQLNKETIGKALEGSTFDVGAVMFLIALSGIFGYGIVWDQVPDKISVGMLGLTDNCLSVMFLIIGFLLFAGCFVDGAVLIIMLTPIFLPIAERARLRSGAFRPDLHHRHHHRQLHAAGGLGHVCGVHDPGRRSATTRASRCRS